MPETLPFLIDRCESGCKIEDKGLLEQIITVNDKLRHWKLKTDTLRSKRTNNVQQLTVALGLPPSEAKYCVLVMKML